jgi:hypothetical protein
MKKIISFLKEHKILVITYALFATLFIPTQKLVTIDKNHIYENRPFAGVLNNEVVGTDLCCDYWLKKDEQPDLAMYKVTKPFFFQIFGMVYTVERL